MLYSHVIYCLSPAHLAALPKFRGPYLFRGYVAICEVGPLIIIIIPLIVSLTQ